MTRQRNSASISARVSKLALALCLACGAASAAPSPEPQRAAAAPTAQRPAPSPAPALVGVAESRLVVIDVQRILQESLAARSVQKQLEAQRAKFQAEISVKEKALNDADNELKELRNTNKDAETLPEREQQLRQKFMAMERDVQSKRHALDEAFTNSMGTVRSALLGVVADLAKSRSIQAVLLKQQALWYDPGLDITDAVLAKLNAQLTDVPVKIDLSALPEAGAAETPTPAAPKN